MPATTTLSDSDITRLAAALVAAGATAPVGALKNVAAARYLGIAPGTLANKRARGDGPPWTKLDGTVVYRVADLDAYLAEHVVGGAK